MPTGSLHITAILAALFLFAGGFRAEADNSGMPGGQDQQTQTDIRKIQQARLEKAKEGIVLEAVSQLQLGNIEKARQILESAARRWPLDDAVRYYLAICQAAEGKNADAEKNLLLAEASDTANVWYKDFLAGFYANSGNEAEASRRYLELLKKHPSEYSNAYTLTLLADSYLSQYKDSLALENYEKALMHTPGYTPALLGKTEVYRMRGNMPAYFAGMTEAMRDSTLNPSAKAQYVDRILHNIDARFYRVWYAQLDSLVNACTQAHPSDSSILKLAGGWYYGTGRKEEGKELFDRLLKAYPEDLDAHYIRLQMLFEDGRLADVVDECNNIIRIGGDNNPKVLPAWSTLGDCYHSIGSAKKAYKAYDKALKIDPEYLPVLNNYAYYLSLEKKKLKKAEQMSRITIEKAPDNATYLDTYGWILYLLKQYEKAKPHFKHAMLYGGKDQPVILEHYAEVLEALGDTETAKYYRNLAESKKK